MRNILSSVYNQFRDMTTELKEFEQIRLKNLVISSACNNKIKDCSEQSLRIFKNWMSATDPDSNYDM